MLKAWGRLSEEGKMLWCKNETTTTTKGKSDKGKAKAIKGNKTLVPS